MSEKNIVKKIDPLVMVKNVLVSVSDKAKLEYFIPSLLEINPSIKFFSTGGTFIKITEILGDKAKRCLTQVSDYTGQPETQGGLVKTLDFKIYLGLLTETYNPAHQEDLKRTDAVPVDMVVCNLYPFAQTIAKPRVTVEEARGNIDIGGPCMIRAAAKNFIRVASVVNPKDYHEILITLGTYNGRIPFHLRLKLARKAFDYTAEYDRTIFDYLFGVSIKEAESCYNQP